MAQRLNDEQLEVISKALVPLFDDLETSVISDIARRVKKTMTYTRTAELMAMEMKKLGYSPNKIRTEVLKTLKATPEYAKEVEKNTLEYKKAVDKIIKDTVARAKEEGNQLVANSGNMSWVNDMSVWESNGVPLTDNTFLPVLVKAIQAQISDGIMNLTKTTGFKGMFGYESVRNMYNRVLNDAVLKVTTGTFSRDTAIRDAIHEMAQSGLRTIDYENGRSVQLDSAVRLCVRTGCAQLSAKITDENIKASGQNLVQVSSHWGARNRGTGIENHEEWQGKVYYIEPQHDYAEEAKRIHQDSIEDLWEKTGYSVDGKHTNNPLGLYGFNCRHRLYPFYEGVSEPLVFPPEPSPVVVDGKELDWYAQSQKMRQMEWKIRNLKREKEALKKFGADKESIAKVDVKISEASRKYNQFCKDIDQRPRTENVRYEVGSTDLHKTQAYKDYQKIASSKMSFPVLHGEEAEEYKIPWSNTPVPKLSKEDLDIAKKYASSKGIAVTNAKSYEGDLKNLKNLIDDADEVAKHYPEIKEGKRRLTINFVESLNDKGAFAETNNHIINIPIYEYRDLELLKSEYLKGVASGDFIKNTTYRDIIKHEVGHVVNNYYGVDGWNIAVKLLPDMSKTDIIDWLITNVSLYSVTPSKLNSELIAECFLGKYSNSNNSFALQFMDEYDSIIGKK